MRFILTILGILTLISGCSQNQASQENRTWSAAGIDVDECHSCGMVVRDQPAPRGQVIHRDGTRAFFCSISDLLLYMETPSPHGKIQQSFVEVMDRAANPNVLDNGELDWLPTETAGYVLGFPRKGIMGLPVLVFENDQIAKEAAETHGGEAMSFAQLQKKIIANQGLSPSL